MVWEGAEVALKELTQDAVEVQGDSACGCRPRRERMGGSTFEIGEYSQIIIQQGAGKEIGS